MTANIEFSFGSLSFSGEGTESWLSAQLNTIIKALPELSELQPPVPAAAANATPGSTAEEGDFTASLAEHLKAKGGDKSQVARFLVTADWLRQRGQKKVNTAAVSKALKDNHQAKLANPSQCLANNISQGFCEKDGSSFFITPGGLKELGYS